MTSTTEAPATVEVTERDLPLHCPNPSMPLWSSHPRVYLEVGAGGDVSCPYCGTRYVLKGPVKSHH
jgi:uncharacterized Zn-finger protein